MSSEDGFTLLELLVVIAIVGILGAVMAPGWLSFMNRQRVNSVQSDLLSLMRESQADAQQQSASRTVVFRNSDDGPVVDVEDTANTIVKTQSLGTNVSNIEIFAFTGDTGDSGNEKDRIEFDYSGGVDSDLVPFTIKVSTDDESPLTKCVIVTTLLGGMIDATGEECDNPNTDT